jgi:hypothetical protein
MLSTTGGMLSTTGKNWNSGTAFESWRLFSFAALITSVSSCLHQFPRTLLIPPSASALWPWASFVRMMVFFCWPSFLAQSKADCAPLSAGAWVWRSCISWRNLTIVSCTGRSRVMCFEESIYPTISGHRDQLKIWWTAVKMWTFLFCWVRRIF